MIRTLSLTTILVTLSIVASPASAQKQRLASLDANGNLDSLIARHAAANNLPEDLVRRVIKRESGGNPRVVITMIGDVPARRIRDGDKQAVRVVFKSGRERVATA